MIRAMLALFVGSLVTLPASAGPLASPTPREVLNRSLEVLEDLEKIRLKGIPAQLLADAQGVVIVPRVVKAGFLVAGGMGHGVVLTRTPKGEWSDPTFVTLGGASFGLQAGVQATDVVLVFRKREPLERVLSGKSKLTLGADASIAAGPVGRQAQAATDPKLQAEILSYSRSRGLFAGVSFSGSALVNDKDNNLSFPLDQRPETAQTLANLKFKLHELAKEVKEIPAQPIPVIKP